MTLLHFLNQLRKNGGDISRLKVSVQDSDSRAWREGIKIKGLRGNKLTVVHGVGGDYELMAGHSCLKGEVNSVVQMPLSRQRRLSDPKESVAGIMVVVSAWKSA